MRIKNGMRTQKFAGKSVSRKAMNNLFMYVETRDTKRST